MTPSHECNSADNSVSGWICSRMWHRHALNVKKVFEGPKDEINLQKKKKNEERDTAL